MSSPAVAAPSRAGAVGPSAVPRAGARPLPAHPARTRRAPVCRSLRARWSLDARFGRKGDAAGLLVEWVRDVGGPLGLTERNTRLSSGQVGAPESRLELEVEFKSMEELEKFWSSIPADAHRRWTSRAAEVIVDGSPAWHVLRAVPLGTALRGGPAAGPPAGAEPPLRVPAPGGDRSDDRMAGTLAKLTGDGGPRFQAGGAKSGARGARIVFGDEGGEPEAIDLQFGDPGSPDRFAVTGTTEGGITLVSLGEGGAPGAGPPADPPAPGALGLSDTARPAGVAGAGLGGAPGPAGRAPRAPGGGASLFADVLREAGAADGQLLSPSVEEEVRRDRRVIEQSQRGIGSGAAGADDGVYDWKGDPMVINPGDVLPFCPPGKRDGGGKPRPGGGDEGRPR